MSQTQTLILSQVTNPPIERPVSVQGRDLVSNGRHSRPFGGGNWYCPAGKMAPEELVALALEYGWNAVWGWVWSCRYRENETWDLPWIFRNGKIDLGRWNQDWFDRIERLAQLCQENNRWLVQLALDGHWGWDSHPLNPAFNHQGVNGGPAPFSNPTPEGWTRIGEMYEKLAQTLKPYPCAVVEIKCQGEWSTQFHRNSANVFKAHGIPTIASSGMRGPGPDGLLAANSDGITISWPDGDGNGGEMAVLLDDEMHYPVQGVLEAESAEASAGYRPLLRREFMSGSEDHNHAGLTTENPDVPPSLMLTDLCSGMGSFIIDPEYPLVGHEGKPWNRPNNPANISARGCPGIANAFLQRIRIKKMIPVEGGEVPMLAATDDREYLAWRFDGGAFGIRLEAGTYHVEWFDHRNKKITKANDVTTGGAVIQFIPPRRAMLLYVYRDDLQSAFPDGWVGGGGTPPPTPDKDGTVRAARAGKKIDKWLGLNAAQRKAQVKILKKARGDLKVAIKRAE